MRKKTSSSGPDLRSGLQTVTMQQNQVRRLKYVEVTEEETVMFGFNRGNKQ